MSINFLTWNVRGIANPGSQRHLHALITRYKLPFVALLEPMTSPDFSFYCRRFGFDHGLFNCSNHIWIMYAAHLHFDILVDHAQLLHCRLTSALLSQPIYLTFVYAKCNRVARYDLWDNLREIAISMEGLPWLVSGDFNIFLHDHERVGGTSDRSDEMLDFAYMIADCELFDAGCEGPIFTWARGGLQERLDRALYNEHWADVFTSSVVTHLSRVRSDHAPLLISCQFLSHVSRSSFRFQHMWIRHHTFLQVVKEAWGPPTGCFGMRNLQHKLNRVKHRLKSWNYQTFGNVLDRVRLADDAVAVAQATYDNDPSPTHRAELHRCVAEYELRLKMEEDFGAE
ncbi:hypothetical protein DH2020_016192 [Rehmannia glutinosa]|uniref:Endonuclease/exonuclease/phosphatase domain-containing protein n=1 Tax=Rehmannia glutinosa TaxID=99300 RepID=A0ABR0W2Y2_REHGL